MIENPDGEFQEIIDINFFSLRGYQLLFIDKSYTITTKYLVEWHLVEL